jgi:hypothetical protein
MSGPIVRKYGFPNFDKIFGERGLEHGTDEPETPSADAPIPPTKAEGPGQGDKPGDPARPSNVGNATGS